MSTELLDTQKSPGKSGIKIGSFLSPQEGGQSVTVYIWTMTLLRERSSFQVSGTGVLKTLCGRGPFSRHIYGL